MIIIVIANPRAGNQLGNCILQMLKRTNKNGGKLYKPLYGL